jgi:hypothetical protein
VCYFVVVLLLFTGQTLKFLEFFKWSKPQYHLKNVEIFSQKSTQLYFQSSIYPCNFYIEMEFHAGKYVLLLLLFTVPIVCDAIFKRCGVLHKQKKVQLYSQNRTPYLLSRDHFKPALSRIEKEIKTIRQVSFLLLLFKDNYVFWLSIWAKYTSSYTWRRWRSSANRGRNIMK